MTTPPQDTAFFTRSGQARDAPRAALLSTRHLVWAGVLAVAAGLPFVFQVANSLNDRVSADFC